MELPCPRTQLGRVAFIHRHIHRAEDFGQNEVRVLSTRIAHLPHRLCEQCATVEDSRIFRKEAKYQSCKEVVKLLTPLVPVPVGIITKQFDI